MGTWTPQSKGAIVSKYHNAGQTCVCANRLYVQSGDAVASKLAERIRQMKVGDGFVEGVTTGPLIDDKALQKVQEHVAMLLGKVTRSKSLVDRPAKAASSSTPRS